MTRLIKVVMAPLLVVAIIGSALFLGLLRPGAASGVMTTLTSGETVRTQLAEAFIDMIIEDQTPLIGVLLQKNREEALATIADVFAEPLQREELGAAAQKWVDAMLAGQPTVAIDPKPLFRPIYRALSQVLPLLQLNEASLETLEPIVLGEDDPLPNLKPVRTLSLIAMTFWAVWVLLLLLLRRRTGRAALRTGGTQALTIGTVGLVATIFAPRLLAGLVNDDGLAQATLTQITTPGIWLTATTAIAGVVLLVLYRRRVS